MTSREGRPDRRNQRPHPQQARPSCSITIKKHQFENAITFRQVAAIVGKLNLDNRSLRMRYLQPIQAKGGAMPRKPRSKSPTGYFHVTLRGNGGQLLFDDAEDRIAMLQILDAILPKRQVTAACHRQRCRCFIPNTSLVPSTHGKCAVASLSPQRNSQGSRGRSMRIWHGNRAVCRRMCSDGTQICLQATSQ